MNPLLAAGPVLGPAAHLADLADAAALATPAQQGLLATTQRAVLQPTAPDERRRSLQPQPPLGAPAAPPVPGAAVAAPLTAPQGPARALRKARLPDRHALWTRLAGGKAPSYYFVPGDAEHSYRASPTRASGMRAKVRWALTADGTPVALRTLRKGAERLVPEALELRAMRAVGPGALPVASFVDHKGRRTLALPLWDGDVFYLAEQISCPRAKKWVGRKLLRDVAGALARLHDAGLVHNDVKPENVLFRRDGSFSPTDFDGVLQLRRAGQSVADGRGIGTPAYVAPEYFDPSQPYDARVDVYKLALTLLCFYDGPAYDRFCGQVPVTPGGSPDLLAAARTSVQLMQAVQTGRTSGQGIDATDMDLTMRLRGSALLQVYRRVFAIDSKVARLLFDRLLVVDPHQRADMAEVLRQAQALLPEGDCHEAEAARALAQQAAAHPVLRQQTDDLRALARLGTHPSALHPYNLLASGSQILRTALAKPR